MTRSLPLLACLVLMPGATVAAPAEPDHGFRFVRIQYENQSAGGMARWGPTWRHDYPTAELNLHQAIERTTGLHVEGPPVVLTLADEAIFAYPVLYLVEPGYWVMEEDEVENLRAYLDRGGFILFDDFRGDREWNHFLEQMRRVFPDEEVVELHPEHPIWSIYYDVDPVEAPSLVSGGFSRYDDRYFGLFDGNGRMMALICHNQDIGDGWEWPDRNLDDASTISFQMGINFIIYALTH
jgi:hypothetical protein